MQEESSHQEARLAREELAREREWLGSPMAGAFATLATMAFDLAHATEAWSSRAAESWITTNEVPISSTVLGELIARITAIAAIVSADLN